MSRVKLAHQVKRLLDVMLSLLVLLAGIPLILAIAIAVLVADGKPVLFTQTRIGVRGKPFTIFKFRTMNDTVGADGTPLPDCMRVTRVGGMLRRTSLDELPEFWNVLRGDMSLIGPRPLLPEYLQMYSPEEHRRHEMKPGLTGCAQIHGRNAVDWKRRLQLDLYYIHHFSLRLDLLILLKTFKVVLSQEGIGSEHSATMPPFRGSDDTPERR